MAFGQRQFFFENAEDKLRRYNQLCLHYNLVANAVYQELRDSKTPFSSNCEPYLIAALISFDMGRMMDKGLAKRYDVGTGGFATRLHRKLAQIQPYLMPIITSNLMEVSIEEHKASIVAAYNNLASGGEEGLNNRGNEFHVGATKVLHFLNPELFAIIDGNTAKTLKRVCNIPYRNTAQPGYSGDLYIQSLFAIRDLIANYGIDRFRSLESGTPLMRIFDKIAFAVNAFMA
jgi:hypothetical protein